MKSSWSSTFRKLLKYITGKNMENSGIALISCIQSDVIESIRISFVEKESTFVLVKNKNAVWDVEMSRM